MPRVMQRMRLGSIVQGTLGLAVACLVTICRPAAASIEYPVLVKNAWGVKKLPVTGADGCPLCHTTDPGMLGTANQKFAVTLKGFGLQAKSDSALQTALEKVKSKMTDSDGDGFSDYEEVVIDSTNPNNASDHPAPMPPETGGSGNGPGSDDAGVTPEAGAPSDPMNTGGTDSGSDENPPDESLGQCTTTTEKVYPTLKTGCNFGTGSSRSRSAMIAGVLAACLVRRRARARKSRRDESGKQA